MIDANAMRGAIERKRSGEELSAAAWRDIVEGYMAGAIDEAQVAALLMACVWRGMTSDEAFALTEAMVASGETIAFPAELRVVDKHSSGGVSDIVSLVAVPLAAACGAYVAKLSGRALGHTGGTIDKLETIDGLDVHLSIERFVGQVQRVGCAIAAQTEQIVPADRRLYALRDRTATVAAMGLIAASIVSKKIAGGAASFVFDVKTGRASFMKTPAESSELAQWLTGIAQRFGRRAVAFVTNMDEPLGRCIGTGIEVIEAREFLRGTGDEPRVRALVLELVEAMLDESEVIDGRARAERALDDGSAYEKLVEMVVAQGATCDALEGLRLSSNRREIVATREGYIGTIDVVRLGHAGRALSANDAVGGLRVEVRIGDRVTKGQPLVTAFGSGSDSVDDLESAFEIDVSAPPPAPLIYEKI
ncbi:MAG: thymidine phosphorylase [Candidatus Eremiobacteraeota bacterium]|nr:thymidine phosphorylase [Candidatus Eremiobacteraeota bacterium]